MSRIALTGNSREEDFLFWSRSMKEELKKESRHIVIDTKKDTQEIVGYLQYSVQEDVFLMEEIEIKALYQGKYNVFKSLCGFVFDNMREEAVFVEAYANKKNAKSIGILVRLGLSIVGETKRGTSYRFRSTYADLLNWYRADQ